MTRRVGLLTLAVVLPAIGCVKTRIESVTATSLSSPSSPGPTLRINGRDHPVGVCRSGDLAYFLGVDLVDESSETLLRVQVDPMDGPRLRVVQGGGNARESVVFSRSSCRQLDARIEHSGWRVNHVRDFNGSLDAECTSDQGMDLQAHVVFTHCH